MFPNIQVYSKNSHVFQNIQVYSKKYKYIAKYPSIFKIIKTYR